MVTALKTGDIRGRHSADHNLYQTCTCVRGVSRIFERGGGPISLGSLKKRSSDFKRGGSNGLMGGVQYISLPKTTNLAYLHAKE